MQSQSPIDYKPGKSSKRASANARNVNVTSKSSHGSQKRVGKAERGGHTLRPGKKKREKKRKKKKLYGSNQTVNKLLYIFKL